MKIQIVDIADRGVPNQERLHLRVLEPTNLGSYLVMSSIWVTPTTVANGNKAVFWYPPQEVKAHDEIVLYTRAGANYVGPAQGLVGAVASGMTYFYFWGQQSTIWNSTDACALLFDVASWAASPNTSAANYFAQLVSGLPSQTGNVLRRPSLTGNDWLDAYNLYGSGKDSDPSSKR